MTVFLEAPQTTGILISIPSMVQQPLVGQGLLIIQVSRSQTVTQNQTPLDDLSARSWDLYLTTHNTHNRQTFMFPTGFEPAIPPNERPQKHALDRPATGIGWMSFYCIILWNMLLTDLSLVDESYAGLWITAYVMAWPWTDWTFGLPWNLEYATYLLKILNSTEFLTN